MEILIQYKEIICVVLAAILEIIIFLVFKKRPKVIDNSILVHLCDWILIAEAKFKNGSDKLNYVLEEAKKYLGDSYVEKDIKMMVEYILTMPEKKEKK